MKILYHHRIRSKDGQFVHIEELIRALRGLGHQIIVVGPAAVQTEAFGSDAGVVQSMKKLLPRALYELLEFGYAFFAYARLWWAVRRHRPDVLYERYNLFQPAGVWLRRTCQLPLLLEVNAPLLDERKKYDGLTLTGLARWTERYAWQGADFVLPVTRVLAARIRQEGVPESKIVVIPNGVNRAQFEEGMDRNAAKRRLGLEGKLVLGFTGFIRDWHGLDRVIDWLAKPRSEMPLHFLVIGDGPSRTALVARARAQGVENHLTITGVIDRDRVASYIAAFDIALQPAVVAYASPLKLFEYMALGCAIVAPATPNIQEIVTDGENAILFDPHDPAAFDRALERICRDPILRDRISRGAKAAIIEQHLTWESNAQTVVELFSRLGAGGIPETRRAERSN